MTEIKSPAVVEPVALRPVALDLGQDAGRDHVPAVAVAPAVAAKRPAPPVLELQGVTASYGGKPVVENISFALGAGQWLALIGPNGAGKSTVLKALAGIRPFTGSIEINGHRYRKRTAASKQIGYVPQDPILPDGMTTAEYVLLGRTAHLRWMQSESETDRRRVGEILEQLNLAPMAGRQVNELSGGEAQRATLARALVQEANVLVLDEPTSALDLANQIAVLELVDDLRQSHGLAVVTALHDLTIAGRFADRLMLLANGAVVANGEPGEVLTETVLSRYYQTPVSVMEGPDGGAVVLPLRTKSRTPHTSQRTEVGDQT